MGKVADKDYFLDEDGGVTEDEAKGSSVLVRKGQEVTTVMTRDHGIDGVDAEEEETPDAEPKAATGATENKAPKKSR